MSQRSRLVLSDGQAWVQNTRLFGISIRALGIEDIVTTRKSIRQRGQKQGRSAEFWHTTGSRATTMLWLLALTPLSPLILLFVPETAKRELEEITSGDPRAS